jgi:hypothetical protein
MKILVRRKTIIKEFAKKIADIQKRADEIYYRDNPPKKNNNELAAWITDKVIPLKEMCQGLGIVKQVYEEAYKIYDFRNSGKTGYTLIDGKIVKQD